MMDELRELYQEVILDHGKNPRNFRQPDCPTCFAHGNNPMCGDKLTVFLTVGQDGIIEDAAFEGRGCAISMASASMMTEILKGKTVADAKSLFGSFHAMCTQDSAAMKGAGVKGAEMNGAGVKGAERIDADAAERLRMLSSVREFPMRVKCATLAWHTMNAAVSDESQGAGAAKEVTTE